MAPIVLYDLLSRVGDRTVPWSWNPWKTRLVLNYKNIPYETEFLNYATLGPRLRSLGVPPKQTEPAYTSPTIRLEDGTFVVDSKVISVELEKRYPEPSLYLDAPELEEVYTQFPIAFRPIIPVIYPGIIHHVVQPDDADHLRKGVEQRHGKSVEAVQTEDGGEPAWEAARESFKGLEDVVKRKGGPFVLGKEPSYADFIVASLLNFALRSDPKVYARIVDMFPAFGALFDACAPWMARDV